MKTRLSEEFSGTAAGKRADAILRNCVHCGFCNATCPTYQLLGDELDGPRGRIYLIKQMLEGEKPGHRTQLHFDRCLSCRSCETACPSGVQYSKLLDLGREYIEATVKRPLRGRFIRYMLVKIIPYPRRVSRLLRLARAFKWLIPSGVVELIPPPSGNSISTPNSRHPRRVLMLNSCVQSVTNPAIDAAAARLLDHFEISVVPLKNGGCCGAMSHHLNANQQAQHLMRSNIDAWWPYVAEAEAILATSSACSLMVREYGDLLHDDPNYADKAKTISSLVRDIAEIISDEDLSRLPNVRDNYRLAFHAPCTLQHGQKLSSVVEVILRRCGFDLTTIYDPHLCCGAAGSYAILQPGISQQLKKNKLGSLMQGTPDTIATANIGCLLHLQHDAGIPVRHWVEILDELLSANG